MTPLTVHVTEYVTIGLLAVVVGRMFQVLVWRPYRHAGRHEAPRAVAGPALTGPAPDYVPDEWDHDSDWTDAQLAALRERPAPAPMPAFDINRLFTPSGAPCTVWPATMTDDELDAWLASRELADAWWMRRR